MLTYAYPDEELIERLSGKFLGQGFDSLTRSEAIALINHLREMVRSQAEVIERFRKEMDREYVGV